jgi:hypothetical protein
VTNEAFARIKIDLLLKNADWRLTDGLSVRYEYPLDDGGRADYGLFDRQGRALAVLEAKSTSVNLGTGEAQGRRYADLLRVPFIFLSNGEEIWFCDKEQDAHFRRVETVFSQDDLARRKAARDIRRSSLEIPIDSRIAGGGGRLASNGRENDFGRALARMRNGNRFPSNDFANIFERAYTFANNYPNIRHPGDSACVRRNLRQEDAVLSALVFVGPSACAHDLCADEV